MSGADQSNVCADSDLRTRKASSSAFCVRTRASLKCASRAVDEFAARKRYSSATRHRRRVQYNAVGISIARVVGAGML